MLAFVASDAAWIALAVFLLAVGLALAWTFVRLAATLNRLSSFIRGTERELLPVIAKVGGSVDRVNAELDKVGVATDSAVDAVQNADEAVRAVSFAVKRPVQKATGLATGISHGWASFRARRNWRGAVDAGKQAAARREADFEEELRRAHG
ncbi:MAG TPA: hypothetical protein VFA88_12370 [Gaiellaceae bacterium]|nr:hypothetical protein [Gaiellaceae bacterium]